MLPRGWGGPAQSLGLVIPLGPIRDSGHVIIASSRLVSPWSFVENNEPTDRNVQGPVVQSLDSSIYYRTNHYLVDKYYFQRFEPKSHSIRA